MWTFFYFSEVTLVKYDAYILVLIICPFVNILDCDLILSPNLFGLNELFVAANFFIK